MIGLRRARPDEQARVEAFQRAAYARTEAAVGARAIPLEWDYAAIMKDCEVWLDEQEGALIGVLILRLLADGLFLESIGTAPQVAGTAGSRRTDHQQSQPCPGVVPETGLHHRS
mgnify:CR=1 FL=1